MRERWVLFYDGACPLCTKVKNKLQTHIPNKNITLIDINGDVAKRKGYNNKQVILETKNQIYQGFGAWLKIISETKYKFLTYVIFRPLLYFLYLFISKNRQYIGKLLK